VNNIDEEDWCLLLQMATVKPMYSFVLLVKIFRYRVASLRMSSTEIQQMFLGVKRQNSQAPEVTVKTLDMMLQFPVILWLLAPLSRTLLPQMLGQFMCLWKTPKRSLLPSSPPRAPQLSPHLSLTKFAQNFTATVVVVAGT
jgi:hypothetical protein